MLIALSLLACATSDTGSAPDNGKGPHGVDPDDVTAPVVSWVSPVEAASVSGVSPLEVSATDDVAVATLRYELDGAVLAELAAEPWTVDWDTVALPNGKHDLTATAVDAAGNEASASVRVNVANGDVGSVTLLSPLEGATVCGELPIEAYSPQTATQVVLFIDGDEKAPDLEAPFFWTWNSPGRSDGAHVLSVVATLADGSLVTDRVTITTDNESGKCDQLPTVRVSQPDYGELVNVAVNVEITATDDKGLASVDLSVDGAAITSWNAEPFTTNWDTEGLSEGSHLLKALATDSNGQTTQTLSAVYVDATAPRTRILEPQYGDMVADTVLITAEVTDASGIASATLYIDGTKQTILYAEPWEWPWDTTTTSGEVELELRSVDNAGRTATDTVVVTVDNLPYIRQSDPADGDTVDGFVSLAASASDDIGVTRVSWDLDGTYLDEDTSSPYRGLFDSCAVASGTYTLTATAEDSAGQLTTDGVTIEVDQPFEIEMGGPSGALDVSETLQVWTTNDVAVDEVDWAIDGVEVARETAGTADASCSSDCSNLCTLYASELDVTTLTDGSHTLTVHATDSAGAEVTSSVTVSVDRDVDGDGYEAEKWGGTDCDDDDGSVSPGTAETCDGADQDCDGEIDEDFDLDLDGFYNDDRCTGGDDCDDNDAAVNPDAIDGCDGIDNDCDGSADVSAAPTTDSGTVGAATLSATVSGQLWANAYSPTRDLTLSSFEVYVDPTDKLLFSVYEATSLSGEYTLVASSTVVATGSLGWYESGSLDTTLLAGRYYLIGFGADSSVGVRYQRSASLTTAAELTPEGLVKSTSSSQPGTVSSTPDSNSLAYQTLNVSWIEDENLDEDGDGQNAWCGDCDDGDATRAEGFAEACDGVDNDCDGAVPADEADADADGDRVCDSDCDDGDASRYPSAYELCDGVDNDCDGDIASDEADVDGDGVAGCWDGFTIDCADDDASTLVSTRYLDADGDGYGDSSTASTACPPDAGMVSVGGDCDDDDAAVSPGETEVCDSVDNDCDGESDEGFDADGDGVGACDDCDDGDATAYPGAEEICGDSVDEDCDGIAPACRYEGSSYAGEADVILFGPTANDAVGGDVGTGDFDNDGQADAFVTAPGANYGGGATSGGLYLVTGPFTGDMTLSTTTATRLYGETSSDSFGYDAAVGDFDNDSLDDVVASATGDDDGGSAAGAVYVIPSASATSGAVLSVAYKLIGETSSDAFGATVAGGDIDGDGRDDVVAGATGSDRGGSSSGGVWLFLGPISAGEDASLADARITGEDSSDSAGVALNGSGDLTGDGVDDIVVGATGDDVGGSNAGALYVVSDPSGNVDLSTADAKLTGGASNDALGGSHPLVLDLDGDGWDDLLAGAYGANGDATDSGVVYGWYGPLSGTKSVTVADVLLLGEAGSDYAGFSLDSAGDADGDGNVDVIIGAYANDTSGSAAGCAYLLYGPLAASTSLSASDAIFLGDSIGDKFAYALAGNEDLNGDGFTDFLMSATASDLVASGAGAVYVLDGGE
ncbi:hypothetical protein LBMAG42_48780 [Deltaproteobacteria bacterium]|nr:hypothetical protein LBMAG42_48780 [Deltaproteobacteria bacterium]